VKCALVLLAGGLAGCGYHVAGHADLMPKTVKTIAVPAFANPTTRFQIARMLPEDVARDGRAGDRQSANHADRARDGQGDLSAKRV
jgi:hypothetical protein